MFINVRDDFLSNDDLEYTDYYCQNAPYYYGEKDDPFKCRPTTGMVNEIYSDDGKFQMGSEQRKIFDIFTKKIESEFEEVKNSVLNRMYVNCFASSENPYFHIDTALPSDKNYYTFLFYANDRTEYDIDDGGETQFYFNKTIYGITPIRNRLICFDSSILHRATPFRDRHRFSIALKYCPKTNESGE